MLKVIFQKSILIGFLLSGLLQFSCSSSGKEESLEKFIAEIDLDVDTISYDSLFTVSVPNSFREVRYLNDRAQLQFNNPFEEKSLIITAEDSRLSFDDYVENSLNEWSKYLGIDRVVQKNVTEGDIYQSAFNVKKRGFPDSLSYFFFYKKGVESFYEIVGWSPVNLKNRYNEELEIVISSLTETKKGDKSLP